MDKTKKSTGRKIKKQYIKVQIEELKPHPKNPKSHKKSLIKSSIDELGYVEPIIIDENNVIIAGHGRLKALKDLKHTEVEVVQVEGWTEEEKERYLLTSNKAVEEGGWIKELLGDFDRDILSKSGFSNEYIDSLLNIETENKDDIAPTTPSETTAKHGDVYSLGKHRLVCGDINQDLDTLMDGKKADMVFTDPPYNVNYTGGSGVYPKNKRKGIENDNMEKEEFYHFLYAACKQMIDRCKGGMYICMSSSEIDTLRKAFDDAGGHWQTFIVWVKNTFTLSRADYQHMYEPILYGWPQKAKDHYFIDRRDIANIWEDLRDIRTQYDKDRNETTIKFQGFEVKVKGQAEGYVKRKKQKTDIWRHDKPSFSKEHPTMKPVSLCTEAITNSSKRGEIVLDPFAGSGSTLIAAEKTDRVCYAMELEPKYIDVIIKRWEEFTGEKAKKL